MKKISLLLVVLLAAGSASLYGQMMINQEFTVSGDATATVGYNIDNEQFGFKNESSASIKLELVPEMSIDNSEMVGMAGWVGSIELNEFKIIIDSGDEDSTEFVSTSPMMDDPMTMDKDEKVAEAKNRTGLIVTKPTIVAMLKNGPLFLKIFAAPGNEAGLIGAIEDDEDDDNRAESDDQPNDVHTDLGGAGVTLGYDSDDLDVAVGITSDEDYDGDYPDRKDDVAKGTPEDASFVLSVDLTVDVGPASLQVQVVQGLMAEEDMDKKADDTGVSALLKTTFGDISLSGGADLLMTGDENDESTREDESMYFETGLNADMTLTENTMFAAKYIYSSEQDVASDVEVSLKDTGGLVDRLGMGLTWGLFDLNNGNAADDAADTENDSMDMLVKGDLSYVLDAMGGKLTPSAELTLNQVDGGDSTLGLTLKAVLTEAVPATEFGLQWKTAQAFDVGDLDGTSGTVTAWAKISYS